MSTLRIRCVKEQYPSSLQMELYHYPSDDCRELEPEHLSLDHTSWRSFHISLSRLTHLEVQRMPFIDMFTILRDAPHLVSFKLAWPTADEKPTPPEPCIKPALEHLSLDDHLEGSVFILNSFNFPSLQSLVFEGQRRYNRAPLTDVINHLRRSGSQLHTLALRRLIYKIEMQFALLADLIGPVMGHNLRHLEVSAESVWAKSVDCLRVATIVQAASVYLPNLRTLKLYSCIRDWPCTLQKLLSVWPSHL